MAYRTIVASGDLFTIAARELGDASQATRIAALNGLTNYQLTGLVTLQIPPVDATLTGGIPSGASGTPVGVYFNPALWDFSTYNSGAVWQ